MYLARLGRNALTLCAVLSVFAGCGVQYDVPRSASPAVTAQGRTRSLESSNELLYVSTGEQTDVLSYPGLKNEGTLTPHGYLGFGTTDPNTGNVFFDDTYMVYEYKHGGSSPIASIDPPYEGDFYYFDCAIDPATSNIAISADKFGMPGGYVAVYTTPSGAPTIYSDPNLASPLFLGYDNKGNLFVDGYGYGTGYVLAELPKGGSTFTDISLNEQLNALLSIQWDGSYMTVRSGNAIYRFTVSGSSGTVVGKTVLSGAWGISNGTFWIQGDTVIGPHLSKTDGNGRHNGRYLGFWRYPLGGKAFKIVTTLSKSQQDRILSATVSAAPSH